MDSNMKVQVRFRDDVRASGWGQDYVVSIRVGFRDSNQVGFQDRVWGRVRDGVSSSFEFRVSGRGSWLDFGTGVGGRGHDPD